MIAQSSDFVRFGDLVCRSRIKRRDVRQFFLIIIYSLVATTVLNLSMQRKIIE